MSDKVLTNEKKAYCNRCCRETNHAVRAKFQVSGGGTHEMTHEEAEAVYMPDSKAEREAFLEEYYEPAWRVRHQLIQCLGCESVSYREITYLEAWGRDDYFRLYPPRVARRRPEWLDRRLQNRDIEELLEEIYSAVQNNSKRLALMGARCAVDVILTNLVGDIGGFERKLERAEVEGLLSKRDKDTLEAALDAGNAAAHRNYKPSDDDLNNVLDIVEHLVQGVLVAPRSAEQVRKTTPARAKKSKPTAASKKSV